MTRLEDRQTLVRDIEQACADGARLAPACALAGIDARTLRRWKAGNGLAHGDRRPDADRPTPSHALSEAERAGIIAVVNEPRFAETPPARIVPALADEGIYIASESSFYRVLRAHGQINRRGRAQPPRPLRPPRYSPASGCQSSVPTGDIVMRSSIGPRRRGQLSASRRWCGAQTATWPRQGSG